MEIKKVQIGSAIQCLKSAVTKWHLTMVIVYVPRDIKNYTDLNEQIPGVGVRTQSPGEKEIKWRRQEFWRRFNQA